MQNPFLAKAGGVLSADIAVPDHEKELEFYAAILTSGNAPLWRNDLTNNLGNPIIGLGPRSAEYEALPLQWMPHFQVNDVAASAAKASELGGEVFMQSEQGPNQWAVLSDPDGAAFGIIPVVNPDDAPTSDGERQGGVGWLSLAVSDPTSSRGFYERVVGWTAKRSELSQVDGAVAEFEMLIDDEISAAEIVRLRDSLNSFPSTWLIYLPVDDIAESLHRVSEKGGQVIENSDGKAIVRDPVGVLIGLKSAI